MEKINVELQSINQISEEYIDSITFKKRGLLKVTTESYYELYENDDEDLKRLGIFETEKLMINELDDIIYEFEYENLVKGD